MESTLSSPFQPPGASRTGGDDAPRAAVIEVVDRHPGPKRPYAGVGSILVPNHMRINGAAVWASAEHPATIHEVVVDGMSQGPFTVTVSLMARALRVGGTPRFVEGAERGGDVSSAAVVEIPDVDEFRDDTEVDRPYVLLNGRRIYVVGPIRVGKLATSGPDQYVAMVQMSLLCRSLLVDDEPAE